MDIGRSFTFITEDEDWLKKILIGGLISLIPFVGQFYLMGYVLETLRNVLHGREIPLPDATEDFGDKLLKGLLLAVITFIYFLPITLISGCSGIASSVFADTLQESDAANTIVAAWGGCFGCLSIVYGILVGLLLPYVWSKYAETGQFGDAFKLGDLFKLLRSNIGPTIVVMLVSWLASAVAGIAGTIACVIGLVFTMFYAQLVTAFLYGSLYRQAKATTL
jgi:uncharacterized membrane protein